MTQDQSDGWLTREHTHARFAVTDPDTRAVLRHGLINIAGREILLDENLTRTLTIANRSIGDCW